MPVVPLPAPNVTIHLGDTSSLDLRVSVVPYLSMLAMLSDAVAGVRRGLTPGVRRRIAGAIRGGGRAALAPIGTPGQSILPDCVVPLVPRVDLGWQTVVSRMRDASRPEIISSIEREFDHRIPSHWAAVAARPRRWMAGFADAVVDSATVIDPFLTRAHPLFDQEIERVGRAAVHDSTDVLLGGLSQRITLVDGSLSFFDPNPGDYQLGDRSLILTPLVAGERVLLSNVDSPDIVWIGYPMPGCQQLWDGGPSPAQEDSLELLLGGPRAMILRFLRHPSTMGDLASSVGFAANTISFHCKHLERAGLVVRERQGKQVSVRRTNRAELLIEVMA